MSMQEIWEIKETLSGKFGGESANGINTAIQSNVDEMNRKIEKLRKGKAETDEN